MGDKRLAIVTGSNSQIINLPMRPGEISNSIVSANTDTLMEIGINPNNQVPLEEGMIETIKYFRYV
jgi:hypothetical protein